MRNFGRKTGILSRDRPERGQDKNVEAVDVIGATVPESGDIVFKMDVDYAIEALLSDFCPFKLVIEGILVLSLQ